MAVPLLGAIRWDGWYSRPEDGLVPGQEMASCISTPEFSGRAPVHAVIEDATTIVYNDDQTSFDAELEAAQRAGINYFAYYLYRTDVQPTMNRGWDYHQASSNKAKVNWCAILSPRMFGETDDFATEVAEIVTWMQQSNYQKVLTNRPLVYIFADAGHITNFWGGGLANFKEAIDALRADAVTAGLGDPYIAYNGSNADRVTLALDASWDYGFGVDLDILEPRAPYEDLANYVSGTVWPARITGGLKHIPCITAGYDPRPYKQRPTSWIQDSGQQLYVGLDKRAIAPTPAEFAAHVQDGLDFVLANPSDCEANASLIYAWNENVECGPLSPTLGDPTGLRLLEIAKSVAVNFDGTNDVARRGAGLTGASDSKLMTMSFWIKPDADGVAYEIVGSAPSTGIATTRLRIRRNASDGLSVLGTNSAGTQILLVGTANDTLEAADGWVHVLMSFDMADTARRFIYLNNVSALTSITTYTDEALDFTYGEFSIGGAGDLTTKYAGDLADFMFWPGVFLDLSVAANRALFINAAGKPVPPRVAVNALGQPIVALTGPLAAWHTNKGTGGGMTMAGELSLATTSPSD